MGIKETLTKIKRRITDEDDELPAYKTNRDVEREGIVFEITHEGVRNSFKVISNTHLLGQK